MHDLESFHLFKYFFRKKKISKSLNPHLTFQIVSSSSLSYTMKHIQEKGRTTKEMIAKVI